jgi:hypothetical protein
MWIRRLAKRHAPYGRRLRRASGEAKLLFPRNMPFSDSTFVNATF